MGASAKISTTAVLISKPADSNSCGEQVVRLSSQDVPTAYAYELEAATIVQPEQVVDAARKIVPQKQMAYA